MAAANPSKLVVEDDMGHRTTHPLARETAGEVVLGRDAKKSQIVLAERNISRRHARLSWNATGDIWIEDLGSYNGVFVNAQRVQRKHALKEGDVVRLGDFQCELLAHDANKTETTRRLMLYHADDHTEPEGGSDADAVKAKPSAERTHPNLIPQAPEVTIPEGLAPAALTSDATIQPAASPRVQPSTLTDESTEQTAVVPLALGQLGRRNSVAQVPHLLVLNTTLAGQAFALAHTTQTLGRGDDNAVVVRHRSVSRQHIRLSTREGRMVVTDLNSANGIRVNGVSVREALLNDGDIVKLGQIKMRFCAVGRVPRLSPQEERRRWMRRLIRPTTRVAIGLAVVAGGAGGIMMLKHVKTPEHIALATTETTLSAPSLEARALLSRARQAAVEHQFGRAVTLVNAALALDPTVEGAASLLERSSAEVRGEAALSRATQARVKNDFETAQRELDDMPEDTEARIHATVLRGQVRDGLVESRLLATRQALDAGHHEAGVSLLHDLKQLAPEDARVTALSSILDPADDIAPVAGQGHRAHAGDIERARVRLQEAIHAQSQGQYVLAVETLRHCLEADPALPGCHRNMAQAYAKLGNPVRAANHLRQYLKLEPRARDAAALQRQLRQLELDGHAIASD